MLGNVRRILRQSRAGTSYASFLPDMPIPVGSGQNRRPTKSLHSDQGDKFRGYPIIQGLHSPSGGPDSCPPDNVGTSGAQHLATIETDTKAERWNEERRRKAKVLPVTDESRPSWRRKIGIKYRRWKKTAGGAEEARRRRRPLSLFHRFSERIPPLSLSYSTDNHG